MAKWSHRDVCGTMTIVTRLVLTLGQICLLRAGVSEFYKTTLISGSVGGAGEWTHTCTLGTFLLCALAISMTTYSNFQINGASVETLKFCWQFLLQ